MRLTHAEIKQIVVDVMENFGPWLDDGTMNADEDDMNRLADLIAQDVLTANASKRVESYDGPITPQENNSGNIG